MRERERAVIGLLVWSRSEVGIGQFLPLTKLVIGHTGFTAPRAES